MKWQRLSLRAATGAIALLAVLEGTWSAAARADEPAPAPTVFPSVAAQPASVEETRYVAPNRAILWSGIGVFLGAYIPSVIVAIANNNTADNRLYYPVAGPWLDLAKRPQCGSQSGRTSCVTEDYYEVLLVIDGVAQALGVGAIAVGAVVPEKHTRIVTATAAPRPTLHVAPLVTHRTYGVAAFGDF